MPTEEFWEWRGNKVHLDRYLNPNAPAKIILHHGVGANGRQLNLIVGKPMVDVVTEVRRRARDGHRDIRHDTHRDHVVGGFSTWAAPCLSGYAWHTKVWIGSEAMSLTDSASLLARVTRLVSQLTPDSPRASPARDTSLSPPPGYPRRNFPTTRNKQISPRGPSH
ncbi:hypothetical protein [Burkholderia multivorans]|uniref:hypothetical protein n=1 Tax=Burkholderia multivorans TaxID=87883 RepID=UPI001FC8B5DC|nr:hypothetical protein [Burkholderia multivorans]MCA8336486.1 hypothetical protein [Burkholderia multivorans]UXZ61923.1 hypothetical protein NUJ28_04140 [Burkholderia multivorans]